MHTEAGLINGFWDINDGPNGDLTWGKTITISRGLNIMVEGEVSATDTKMTMNFTGSDTDGKLQTNHFAAGTGAGMTTRTYSMIYEIEDGDRDCGEGCRK